MNVSHQYPYIFYQSRIYEQCLPDKAIKRSCKNRKQLVSTIKLIKNNVRKSRRNLNVKQANIYTEKQN